MKLAKFFIVAIVAIVALVAFSAALSAQAQEKRVLTREVFDSWRSIHGPKLSDDGRFALYTLAPQVGDGELVVKALPAGAEYRHPRGFLGRPQTRPGAGPRAGYTIPDAQFTSDSRFVLFLIEQPRAEFERARTEKKKTSDQPKPALGIMSTADGRTTVIQKVKSFQLAKESGRFVAYMLDVGDTASQKDTTVGPAVPAPQAAAAAPGGKARPISLDSTAKKPRKTEYGFTLVIRELTSGGESRIEDVTEYTFDQRGTSLAYLVSSRVTQRNGAYARTLSDGKTVTLRAGSGNYKGIAFDRSGERVGFLAGSEDGKRESPRHALYLASLRDRDARALVGPSELGDSLMVSDKARIEFTEDGRTVMFGVAPVPLDSIPADSLYDKAVFDLWHWQDARLQPQQIVEAQSDRDRSFSAVYLLDTRKYVRVGNDTLRQVRFARNGRTAVANTAVPYSIEAMWATSRNDVYVINANTGTRTLVKTRLPFGATISPDGKYVLYFGEDGRWYSFVVATGRTVDLTGRLGAHFDQETWDTPSVPAPWGVAGWTKGDRSVLIYDRYDVWEIDPVGARSSRVVTDSVGRRERVVFRVVTLDTTAQSIDPARPLLLRATNDETKASGFWRDGLDTLAPPRMLMMADKRMGAPSKARRASVFMFDQSTFREFPDLWVANADFADQTRISDANPQKRDFRWGSAELVGWRSDDGIPLRGILYKPDEFDASKRYPMVVYFYEQLSDNLHSYIPPTGRHSINPTVYVSNGYLVFEPDVHYTEGYPGASAMKSIVPGVQMLIAKGFVDPAGVGIQGHSWGGYQIAYMITRTNLFRAAEAGAPVANMTSAYGGIRWESGLARAFQYEKTQSRIAGSIWERPWRYIENSPLFAADRVQTPLLMMHNDADGAVPWYQGIEMFVALRRLGKEVYLFNYNGEGHGPSKRANQLDFSVRTQQFFDHHLRGAPAPEWMVKGIPFLQKGRQPIAAPPVAAAQSP